MPTTAYQTESGRIDLEIDTDDSSDYLENDRTRKEFQIRGRCSKIIRHTSRPSDNGNTDNHRYDQRCPYRAERYLRR